MKKLMVLALAFSALSMFNGCISNYYQEKVKGDHVESARWVCACVVVPLYFSYSLKPVDVVDVEVPPTKPIAVPRPLEPEKKQ